MGLWSLYLETTLRTVGPPWFSVSAKEKEQERSLVRSHPLVLQTMRTVVAEREAVDDSSMGMSVLSTEASAQTTRSFYTGAQDCLPSPGTGTKGRKHNNKDCSSFNLCSSSIACCKQCLIYVFSLIARNKWQIGVQSHLRRSPKQLPRGTSWRLGPHTSRPFPQGAWLMTVTDVRQDCPGSSGVWSGRGPPLPHFPK